MASIVGPKSIMLDAFLLVFLFPFLLQSSILVDGATVDITYFDNKWGCSGVGVACYGISAGRCCVTGALSAGSVSSRANVGVAAACIGSQYYTKGSCTTGSHLGQSSGNFCYYSGRSTIGFSATFWYRACTRRRSLLSDHEPTTLQTCTSQTNPNAVVFTEDDTRGHWVLSSSNVSETYSQLSNVNEADKLDWIKGKGASYREFDSTMLLGTQELQN